MRLKKGQEKTEEYQDLLKKILRIDPENKETYLRLGKLYMDNGDYEDALDLFTRMVQHFPDYYVAHFYLGETFIAMGQDNRAMASFEKTLALEPDLVEPRFRIVELLKKQPDSEENRQHIRLWFDEILKIDPGNDRAAFEMALFHFKRGKKKRLNHCLVSWPRRQGPIPGCSCPPLMRSSLPNGFKTPSLFSLN